MNSQSNNQFYQPLLFAFVLIAGMFLGFKIASSYFSSKTNIFSVNKDKTYLDYLVTLIADRYVDSLDRQTLYENGVEGIISSLDPHTVYIPPQETDHVNEELEGNIFGIGIEFFIYKDTIHVLSVLDNSPAKTKNIHPGDMILKIDDSLLAGRKTASEDVIKLIKGQKNTLVSLSIQKPDGKITEVKLERETITHNSIVSSFVLPQYPQTGYISIRIFSENTYQEFREALQRLLKQNISKLIIDVRDNPGGYMDAVTSILDELVAGKHTLLSTRSKTENEIVSSGEKGIFENGSVCVLINENSASASEILAGVVQDLDRGKVIGRRSYGKGLVQEQFTLPDNAAIRITVARYYLPSGRCIQKDYSHGKNEYQHEIYERYFKQNAADSNADIRKVPQKFYTGKGRVVYGNEGVAPDIKVNGDSSDHAVFDSVYHFNLIELFAADYYFFHKREFRNFTNDQIFESKFMIGEAMSKTLYDYLHQNVKSITGSVFSAYKKKIFTLLKAEFGKLHLGNNTKYMILSSEDRMVQEAARQMHQNRS